MIIFFRNDLKKWLSEKGNQQQNNNNNNEENQKSLRVTLNKNFSKANLMSTKLFESSLQNNPNLKNNNSAGNFPKIKGSVSPNSEIRRESSPLSESESMKILRQQVKNKKIAIDDRKTNSVSQNRKEELNNSKVKFTLK